MLPASVRSLSQFLHVLDQDIAISRAKIVGATRAESVNRVIYLVGFENKPSTTPATLRRVDSPQRSRRLKLSSFRNVRASELTMPSLDAFPVELQELVISHLSSKSYPCNATLTYKWMATLAQSLLCCSFLQDEDPYADAAFLFLRTALHRPDLVRNTEYLSLPV